MTDEWPKAWDDILTDTDDLLFVSSNTWMDLGPIRLYEGTTYVSIDFGSETDENRDLWMPFDVYVKNRVE